MESLYNMFKRRGKELHVHIGILHALTTFLTVIVVGFFWRWLSMTKSDTAWGQAMAFLY